MQKIDIVTYIEGHSDKEFEWGRTDCFTFVGNYYYVNTKRDLCRKFRGKYKNIKDIMRLCKQYNVREPFIQLIKDLKSDGFKRIKKDFRNGDIGVFVAPDKTRGFGLMYEGWLIALGAQGIVHIHPKKIKEVYRCPKLQP